MSARDIGQRMSGDRRVLDGVSLRIRPGQVTAIAGNSGAGKTVLLEILAGIRRPTTGAVRYDGASPAQLRSALGFVPQEDIVHRDLPLARTLEYAARLRMPAGATQAEITATVARVLQTLGLTDRAAQRVGWLSGGERKRASIAVELMTRPRVLFLDEPTSGLDPATGAELMATLRTLAEQGTTVVLSTHTPGDLLRSDEVAFLAADGSLAYTGPAQDLCERFAVATLEEVYGAVGGGAVSGSPADRRTDGERSTSGDSAVDGPRNGGSSNLGSAAVGPAHGTPAAQASTDGESARDPAAPVLGAFAQWALFTRRSAEILLNNRLTLTVLIGSPLAIVAMFALLFKPGAFDPSSPDPSSSAMILFWIAFGGFFFGLSYGLLQICTELPIIRRERLTVLRLGPYVLSKLAVLLPVLVAADVVLLAVLRGLDRLPAAGWDVYGSLFVTLLLASAAALALGLLVSAAVSEPNQATLMLPLLCFPQVLFSGAFVPVPRMAWLGELLSYAMTNRWAFEALGRGMDVEELWAGGGSPLGAPLLATYGDTFGGPALLGWSVLTGATAVLLAATWAVLARGCRRAGLVSSAVEG